MTTSTSSPARKVDTRQSKTTSAGPRRRSFKEAKELQQLDQQLPQLEQRKAALEEKLATHDRDLSELSVELAELITKIEAAEERWLDLSELQA